MLDLGSTLLGSGNKGFVLPRTLVKGHIPKSQLLSKPLGTPHQMAFSELVDLLAEDAGFGMSMNKLRD